MKRKNQECVDVDISLSVLKDQIGNVIGSIGIIKDNSRSKQMEAGIETSEGNSNNSMKKHRFPIIRYRQIREP